MFYTPQYSRESIIWHQNFELMAGVEPATSSLPRMRSTTELHQQHSLNRLPLVTRVYKQKLSGKRGSNPRPPAWKASALSTELFPRINHDFRDGYFVIGGSRWIRTTEGENQQIYSLPHLAALEYSQYYFNVRFFEPLVGFEPTTPRLQITCSGQLS